MGDQVATGEIPASFDDLASSGPGAERCARCGAAPTHSLLLTITKREAGKGALVRNLRRTPVCEACAVRLYVTIARAVRAM